MINTLSRMMRTGILTERVPQIPKVEVPIGEIQKQISKLLGRALCIRHVDAGSCNGCELEIQALNNPYYNIEGIGIKFVASPRHADLLLVTGPVSVNMEEALRERLTPFRIPSLSLPSVTAALVVGFLVKVTQAEALSPMLYPSIIT